MRRPTRDHVEQTARFLRQNGVTERSTMTVPPEFEEFFKSVHDFADAVQGWRAQSVDRETVERIVQDVVKHGESKHWGD
jgi:ribosome modulation factor